MSGTVLDPREIAVNKQPKILLFMESIEEYTKYICQMVARALEKNKAGLGQVSKAVESGRSLFYTKQPEKCSLMK